MTITTKKAVLGTTSALALALTLGATSASALSIATTQVSGSVDASVTTNINANTGSTNIRNTVHANANGSVASSSSHIQTGSNTAHRMNMMVNGHFGTSTGASLKVRASSTMDAAHNLNASATAMMNNDMNSMNQVHVSFASRLSAWFRSLFGFSGSTHTTVDSNVSSNSNNQ